MSEPLWGGSRGQRAVVVGAMLTATFLASLEVTVVSTAMPVVSRQLGDSALYPWVFSVYLVTATASIPVYGRLADLWGRKWTALMGLGLFVMASLLCGGATTMGGLIAARALQGLGGGCIQPLTMAVFGDVFPPAQRARWMGLFSLAWGLSSVVGPLAGGVIVSRWSWPWIFYLNVPLGLASILALVMALPSEKKRGMGSGGLDPSGTTLVLLSVGALLVALLPPSQREGAGIGPSTLWWGIAVAAAFLLAWVEKRAPHPVVPLPLLRNRVQVAAVGSGLFLGASLFGVITYVPLFLQETKGWSPEEAGATLLPMSVGWTVGAFGSGRLFTRFGFRPVVRVGGILVSLGTGLTFWGATRAHPALFPLAMGVFGLGMGASVTALMVVVQEDAPPSQRGVATALTQFARSMGGAIGPAALGAWMASSDPTQGVARVFGPVALLGVGVALVGMSLFPEVGVSGKSVTPS